MLRAAWKSLMARKVRLLMSTFAIVLGVAFVGGTLIFTDTLNKSFTAIFDNTVGDVVVRPASVSGSESQQTTLTLPSSLVATLAKVPGAARADGNVSSLGVFVIGENNKVIGGNGAPGLGVNDTMAPAAHGIAPLQVVRGKRPQGPDQVAIDAETVRRAGYHLGQRVRLTSPGAQALLQPTLVGIADFPDGGSLNGATVSMFDTHTAQQLFLGGKDEFNDAWVTAKPGVSQTQLRDAVAKVLPDKYVAVTGAKAAKQQASELLDAISFLTVFLLVFAGIALVVGSFLIVNTFSMIVAQRSRELALFRALGASRRQVNRSVLFEAFVLGLIGSSIGLALGVGLAVGIRAIFANFGLDLSGTALVFKPRTVLWCYAVGLVVTMVAAWLPARRSGRIPPIAALRDDVAMPESALHRRLIFGALLAVAGAVMAGLGLAADISQPALWVGLGALAILLGTAAASPVLAVPFLAVVSAIYSNRFGSVGDLAGKNARRNPRRTAATASALMIGLALVTTMAVAGASAKASVDETVKDTFLGDLVVSNAIGQGFSPEIADMAAAEPGVASVTRTRFASGTLNGKSTFVVGSEPSTLASVLRVKMLQGRLADLNDTSILVGKKQAADHGYRVGQELHFTFPAGRTTLRIAGIYDANFGTGYLTTLGTLVKGGFAPQDNTLFIKLKPGVDPAQVKAALDKATAALPIITVKNQREYAAEQSAPIDQLVRMIYALLGLALVIAVLGVVNTLGLSVIERTREIGLLRAVGLSRWQLRRMIGLESVAIALLGAVLGVLLGLAFGTALMGSLRDQGLTITRIPWSNVVMFLLASVLIGLVSALFPARRAARLDVLKAIATE